ncbi:MAG: glycine--tRNA ligase subunit beta [Sphingomonas sp.]|nr:glycine--tRNA ligase subunit beta [Sphingomonas sp.]
MSDRLASGATTNACADFLLELLCEEIPARMQAGARRDLERLFGEELEKAGLSSDAVEIFSTPRRLALIARGLPLETQARSEEIKGPRTSAPPQALDGFLRKTGLAKEQLEERDGVFYAVIASDSMPASQLLGPAIERIVRGFPWPKSMRWGEASASTSSLRWVRPLHGIVALLGEEIVPVSVDGIAAGATTLGHRFHHPGPITIGGAHDYCEKLRACDVIVDHGEREALIRDGAATAASEAGLALVEDEGLVVENAGLTEKPVPLLGRFDADYLDVPSEVIVLTMRANQKYFACTDASGELAPAFVCVANIAAADGGQSIVEGNRRVLAARLSDARFFWEQDLKGPLEEQAEKLSGIVFHEKLGTVADKVERVAKLARWLVEEGIIEGADPDQVERAARLAKADLVTGMVGEFPELQGVIGGYLARAQGEPDAVADAIRDHYKPVGQGDEVPTAPVTVAVSMADKLDTISVFFAIDQRPTGSKDPYALRRAVIAVLVLVTENDLRLGIITPIVDSQVTLTEQKMQLVKGLTEVFQSTEFELPLIRAAAAERLAKEGANLEQLTGVMKKGGAAFINALSDFFADRLKVQQREAGVRHDLIDAVFALGGEDDLVRLLARVRALQDFVGTQEGGDLLTAYKRAANILKKEKWERRQTPDQVRGDGLASQEQALITALDEAEPRASKAVEAEDFTSAMAALASLRSPIDAFFEKVTVNDPNEATRARRLSLLMRFRDAVNRVADFSKIEG